MQTPVLFRSYALILVFISICTLSNAQIAKTKFPKSGELKSKDEWKEFWDSFGLGRYNNGGAQFTSKPITIKDGVLTIPFSKGDEGGAAHKNTGAIIYASEPHHTGRSVYTEYEIKFSKDFDWGVEGEKYRGGKFGLGFTVGKVGVGKNPGKGNFQVTTMWRGGGKMDAYIYHAGQKTQGGKWPDKQIYATLETDRWYKFGMQLTLNDPGKDNGRVEIWIDNKIAYDRNDFRFSDDKEVTFKPSFGTFWGGSGAGWIARNDCEVFYKDVSIWEQNPFGSDRGPQTEEDPIEVVATPEMKVFPNPVKGGSFTIEMKELETGELKFMDVLDLAGRRLYTQSLSELSQQIQLPMQLPYGLYIVRVATSKGNLSKRLIIE